MQQHCKQLVSYLQQQQSQRKLCATAQLCSFTLQAAAHVTAATAAAAATATATIATAAATTAVARCLH
jgi:hypothetical protein